MQLAQMWFLDYPYLQLVADERDDEAGDSDDVGTISVRPRNVSCAALSTGLRTNRNGPLVTRVVFSVVSNPMRQEAPIANWAAKVAKMPSPVRATPNRE